MSEKPILFNTDMVRAILDGRKSRTSRPIAEKVKDHWDSLFWNCERSTKYAPYQPGDILWVRETWCRVKDLPMWQEYRYGDGKQANPEEYCYRADSNIPDPNTKWRPSIHMPREAARIFLRVTNVRAQRLEDVTEQDAIEDGFKVRPQFSALVQFKHFWHQQYGDDVRWMWVYEFERTKQS